MNTLTGHDRTARALEQYVDALPAPGYDLRAIAPGQTPKVRQVTRDKLLASVAWLRHCNAQGANVYLRPLTARHVLVDDLSDVTLAAITAAHRISCIIETSPSSYQAWITLSEQDVDPTTATRVARALAVRFDGDPGAASAFQPGRAPGLQNRKPARIGPDGRGPWVAVRHAQSVVDPTATELMASAHETPTGVAVRELRLVTHPASEGRMLRSPAEEYAEAEDRLARMLPGSQLDRSRLDYAIARRLFGLGYKTDAVAAVLHMSAKVRAMRDAEADQYIRRTLEAALSCAVRGGRT
jgi:hypothetical protein